MTFLDSNILLRHVLKDDPIQSPASRSLIQAIEQGRVTVWTSDLTVAEVVWVLSNKRTYNLPREQIRDALLPLIDLPHLKLARKRLYSRVFELYTSLPIDYVDCYHAALLERTSDPSIYSFDKDFDDIARISRVEPTLGQR